MRQFKKLSDMVIGGYMLADKSKEIETMAKAEKGQTLLLYENSLIMKQGSERQFVRPLTVKERKKVSDYLISGLNDKSLYDYKGAYYWNRVKAYESQTLNVHEFNPFAGMPSDPVFWILADRL